MSIQKLFSLFALVSLSSLSVAACAASTDAPADGTPADSTLDQELRASITACHADSDCVAVPKGGCCDNGWLFAVNAHKVKAYEKATKCTANPRPMCPMFMVHDTRVAACNTTTNQCEMVEPPPPPVDAGPSDCRATGCAAGQFCSFCWGSYACIPDHAMC